MKSTNLGEFEELVLLTIVALFDEAYGVAVKEDLEKRTQREVSVGAMYSALNRLEKKNFISSKWGESTRARGGKRKRLFNITNSGKRALIQSRSVREELWDLSKGLILDLK